MLKISRLTDYGLLAAVYLARKAGEVVSAREIAAFYHLPLPMITKVLKTLHQGDVIESHRGVGGGYSFDGDAESVTLGQLLDVLEGPWDLVECESLDQQGHAVCAIRVACPSRTLHVRHQPRGQGRLRAGHARRSRPRRHAAGRRRQTAARTGRVTAMTTEPTIEQIANQEYKYGFVTDIEADTLPPGLNEDIVRLISAKKNEPEWHARVAPQGVSATG